VSIDGSTDSHGHSTAPEQSHPVAIAAHITPHLPVLWLRALQNVVLISIASVMDPSLAPEGKHCLHAYLPATEPYALWEGLDRKR